MGTLSPTFNRQKGSFVKINPTTNPFVERSHFKVNEVSSFLFVNTNIQRFASDIFPAGNVLEMVGHSGWQTH